jgi:hypothetical protein
MSRLTNGSVPEESSISAASLNTRLTAFTQTDLNQFNTRDAAIDLPQMDTGGFMVPQMAIRQIGSQNWTHTAYNTEVGQVTGDAPHIVRDAAVAPTDLALGAGWTVGTDQMLRVYWDLSVRPRWDSSRPWAGTDWEWTFTNKSGAGAVRVANMTGCWAFWLQWDTTSAALLNFTNVPSQDSFNTPVLSGPRGGSLLANLQATSIVPCVNEVLAAPDNGRADTVNTHVPIGWTSVDGAWHYVPGSPITIYGLRVVFTGPLGAYNAASNWLVRSDVLAPDAILDYNGGSLQALLMRLA